MRSKSLLDPDASTQVTAIPPLELTRDNLAEIRGWMDSIAASAPTAGVEVTEHSIAGGQGGICILVYRPSNAAGILPALLHCHAGGFVVGSPETHVAANSALAECLQCFIVSVGYRLAPETQFPGPLDDCYDALCWLYRNASDLSVDPTRIAVFGHSAGGGLAASLALRARDGGEVPLVFQALLYPMLDDRTGSAMDAAPHPYAGEFVWTAANNRFGWSCLLGAEPGGADVSPLASPARATSLEALPPAFIAVGALDLFAEECMEYARRLIRSGVPTELHVYPGSTHAFDALAGTRHRASVEEALRGAVRRAFDP